MESTKSESQDVSAISPAQSSYSAFLHDLSELDPSLESLRGLSSVSDQQFRTIDVLSKFSLLLSTLKVPGPCALVEDGPELGCGAQFKVWRQEITGISPGNTSKPVYHNHVQDAAVKIPKFAIESNLKVDLSDPAVSQQVRHMIIEITALCHPKLRDHANIVNLFAWGFSGEDTRPQPCIALELARYDLASLFGKFCDIPVKLKHHISLDIAYGLDAVHEVGLIHGDLKPQNILVFRRGEYILAKLADFGGGAEIVESDSLRGLGTRGWRAPELRRFQEESQCLVPSLLQALDSYSYGLIIWSILLLDGQSAPCSESDDAEKLFPLDVDDFGEDLPVSLCDALATSLDLLLKEEPRARPGRLGSLLQDGTIESPHYRAATGHNNIPLIKETDSDASVSDADSDYDWPVPEINIELVPDLRSSLLKGEPFTSDLVDVLLLKILSYGPRLQSQKDDMEFLLKLLHDGVRLGSKLSKAFVYPLYQFLQLQPDKEFQNLIRRCVAEAIAEGAFFLRKTMRSLDSNLLEESIDLFQENGGYNRFYGGWDEEATLILKESAIDRKEVYSYEDTPLNVRGDTLLHIICSSNAIADLSTWVRHKDVEEIDYVNERRETALYRACMSGVTSHVLTLLAYGANPSLKPRDEGPSCLHWLFQFKTHDVETVARALVEHGADIHTSSNYNIRMLYYPFTLPLGTALDWAVAMSAIEAVHALINLGADPSLRNGCDPYLFDDSVRRLNTSLPPDMIQCRFADHSTLGVSAIDLAVKNRDHEVLNILLSDKSKFRPNDSDEEGFTAVHRLDSGEWLYTVEGSTIWRPLFQGDSTSRFHSLQKTVAILCENGYNLDKFNKLTESSGNTMGVFEQTALMIAVWKGQSSTVKVLLNAGADVNVANPAGYTALMSFTDHYMDDEPLQAEVLSLLLAANAKIDTCAKNSVCHLTPLLHACLLHLQKVVEVLISLGASLEDHFENVRPSSNGITALALMVEWTPAERTSTGPMKTDRWLHGILERHVMPLLSRDEDGELRCKLLETADLQGGGMLHYAAGAGLIQTCTMLLIAKVAVNKLRRVEKDETRLGIRGKEISFNTPLDEVMKAKESCRFKTQYVQEEELSSQIAIYDDVAQLLKNAGGVLGDDIVGEKEFIPSSVQPPHVSWEEIRSWSDEVWEEKLREF